MPQTADFRKSARRTLRIVLLAAVVVFLLSGAAMAEEPHDHTNHDDWTKLDPATSGYTLSNGKYYLDDTVTLSQTLTITGEVTLCLNGGVLKGSGSHPVITVSSGATLNLYDCPGEAEHQFSDTNNDGLWELTDGAGDKTVKGGVITGGYSGDKGGGVSSSGTFNMYGGTIAGNKAYSGGGGIGVVSGTFLLSGGTITGNYGDQGGAIAIWGSGFQSIQIENATITNNKASNSAGILVLADKAITIKNTTIAQNSAGHGVGITFYGVTAELTNVTITGNTATTSTAGINFENANNHITLTNVTISKNTVTDSDGYGGGISSTLGSNVILILQNVTITENSAMKHGAGIYFNDKIGSITVSGETNITGNTAGSVENNIQLAQNKFLTIDASQGVSGSIGVTPYTVPDSSGNSVKIAAVQGDGTVPTNLLTLNHEYAQQFKIEQTSTDIVLSIVEGGDTLSTVQHTAHDDVTEWYAWGEDKLPTPFAHTFVLTKDITLTETWEVKTDTVLCLNGHNLTRSGAGVVIEVETGAKLTLCDCSDAEYRYAITDYKAELSNEGQYVLTGGIITGGTAGGINVAGGTLNMTGGNIFKNIGAGVSSSGTFIMYNGTIAGNTDSGVSSFGTFTMYNGTIAGNTKSGYGGGVDQQSGSVTIHGGTITSNSGSQGGGGIILRAQFQIANVSIVNNKGGYGAGVLPHGAAGTLTNVTIKGNAATRNGGGIGFSSGTTGLTLTNVTITENTAVTHGGGISFADPDSKRLTMTNVTITKNTVTNNDGHGGGIYHDNALTSITVSGETIIAENKKGDAENNIEFASGKTLTIPELLTGSAKIGVTMQTPGTFTTTNPANTEFFFADSDTYLIGTGEPTGDTVPLLIGTKQTLTWIIDENKIDTTVPYTEGEIAAGSHITYPTLSTTEGEGEEGADSLAWIEKDTGRPFSERVMPDRDLILTTARSAQTETYILTIPETITLESDPNKLTSSWVALTQNEANKQYDVQVQSKNSWKVQSDIGEQIGYKMTADGTDITGNPGIVLQAGTGESGKTHTVPVTFSLTQTPSATGTYTDLLTFTVSVSDKQADGTGDGAGEGTGEGTGTGEETAPENEPAEAAELAPLAEGYP